MPPNGNTRKIVVDSEGRITALIGVADEPGVPDQLSVGSLSLHIGDRIVIDDVMRQTDGGNAHKFLVWAKKESSDCECPPIAELRSPFKIEPSSNLMNHAIETFGPDRAAGEWLSIECGALNNQAPADFLKNTGNEAEVERILGYIDYGMIA